MGDESTRIMTTIKRPLSVSILAWITLIVAVVELAAAAIVLFMPTVRENLISIGFHTSKQAIIQLPLSIHYLVGGITPLLLLAAGVGVLYAKNWARFIIVMWGGLMLLFTYITTGSIVFTAQQSIVYIIIIIILFSRKAHTYFSTRKS